MPRVGPSRRSWTRCVRRPRWQGAALWFLKHNSYWAYRDRTYYIRTIISELIEIYILVGIHGGYEDYTNYGC